MRYIYRKRIFVRYFKQLNFWDEENQLPSDAHTIRLTQMVPGVPFTPVQNAGARPKNGDQEINVFGAQNEIHVLPPGFIVSTEVILSPVIFHRCNYFILAKNINFPPFLGGPDFLVLLRQGKSTYNIIDRSVRC